ncbi:MAG: transposase zinc-binding domain-containing protein, partial [Planctomycetota bacterium]
MADGETSRARRSYPDLSPRDPSKSALHAILRDHLETFLAEREEAGAPLPRFVTKELRAALSCGVLRNGCAHYRCDGCGLSRVVALSCKGRGFCPRCIGRQMTVLARELTERVFPDVRSRQWVLSFPFGLRCALAFDHELTLALTRVAQCEIERRYRRLAREAGLTKPRGGAFVAIQRCGADLRPNVHLHALFLDGAYGTNAHGREVFFEAPAPTPAEVEAILTRIVSRARALLAEREPDLDALDESERSLAETLAAATSTRGTTSHAPELDDDHGAQVHLSTRRKARIEDFDLDAVLAIAPHDRERREAMFRYFLRPPLAHDRLTYLPAGLDSRVLLSLKRPRSDG